jgi:putative addiction module component (TIGR02574 family)
MAQVTPQLSELLEKALALSTQDRGVLIDRLIASPDEQPAEEGAEAAWEEEITRRMDDILSGRVKTIPGEQVLGRLKARQRDAKA